MKAATHGGNYLKAQQGNSSMLSADLQNYLIKHLFYQFKEKSISIENTVLDLFIRSSIGLIAINVPFKNVTYRSMPYDSPSPLQHCKVTQQCITQY